MRRVRISHETRPVSGDSVMMGVIMQKCDDTNPVVTDDQPILPSERGCIIITGLLRILDSLSNHVTNVPV